MNFTPGEPWPLGLALAFLVSALVRRPSPDFLRRGAALYTFLVLGTVLLLRGIVKDPWQASLWQDRLFPFLALYAGTFSSWYYGSRGIGASFLVLLLTVAASSLAFALLPGYLFPGGKYSSWMYSAAGGFYLYLGAWLAGMVAVRWLHRKGRNE